MHDPLMILMVVFFSVCAVVVWFVATELRNNDLVRLVQNSLKDVRARWQILTDKISAGRTLGEQCDINFDWLARLAHGADICLREANEDLERDPSNVKSYHLAMKSIKAAVRQLNIIESTLAGKN